MKWSGVRGSNPHGSAAFRYFTGPTVLRVSRSGTVQFGARTRGGARASSRRQTWISNPSLCPVRRKPADSYISRPDLARNPFVLCIFSPVLPDRATSSPVMTGLRLPSSANASCQNEKRRSTFPPCPLGPIEGLPFYVGRRSKTPFFIAREATGHGEDPQRERKDQSSSSVSKSNTRGVSPSWKTPPKGHRAISKPDALFSAHANHRLQMGPQAGLEPASPLPSPSCFTRAHGAGRYPGQDIARTVHRESRTPAARLHCHCDTAAKRGA